MSQSTINEILEMDGEARYDYFLDAVADQREIWILVNADNHFLQIVSEEERIAYLPVWPSADFASDYAKGADELSPKAISLPDFFQRWVSGLTRDGLEVGVLPGADGELWITEPRQLKDDLQEAMSSF